MIDAINLTRKVRTILQNVPASRNSDITLTLSIWVTYHKDMLQEDPRRPGKYVVPLRHVFDLPREDNIKRIRAKIQNEERLYLPTDPEILMQRAKLSKEWRTFLGYNTYWDDKAWQNAIDNYLEEEAKPKQGGLI